MKRISLILLCAGLIGSWVAVRGTVTQAVEDHRSGRWTLCAISAREDVEVEIFTDSLLKTDKPLYCEVKSGGQKFVSMVRFATVGVDDDVSAEDFIVLQAEQGNVLGITFKAEPSKLLFVLEFSKDEVWKKYTGISEDPVSVERMLAALKQATGNPDLSLAAHEGALE
jgi:hypothetical protein